MTRPRTRALLIAAVAVVAAVVIWFATHRTSAPAAPEASAPSVPTVAVTTGAFDVKITAQGRVGPPAGSSARIAFAEPGIIGSLTVRVGDRVTAGETIARLRPESFQIALDQATADAVAASQSYGGGTVPNAALASTQAKLVVARQRLQTLQSGGQAALSNRIAAVSAARQAAVKVDADRTNLTRQQTLFTGGVAAARDVDAARTQLAGDEADQRAADAKVQAAGADLNAALQQARADVAQAESDVRAASAQRGVLGAQSGSAAAREATAQLALDNTALRAPAAGIVMAILKHTGEAVDVTTPVVEIGPADDASVTLQVPGSAAASVHIGDPVDVALSQSGRHSAAVVTAVVPAVDPATQIATVVAGHIPAGAVPGDAVSATIVVAHRRGLIVPSSALVQDPQTGNTVVFIAAHDGSFSMKTVTVTASDARSALLASGVRAGQRIAARGGYELLAPSGGG